MRGVGKSTVGVILARTIAAPFHDLDDLVLSRLGATSVKQIFQDCEEHVWREAEVSALKAHLCSVAVAEPSVLAIGGGAPINPDCAQLLRSARLTGWRIVYLTAPIEVLAERLERDFGDRTMLTDLSLVAELTQQEQQRTTAYVALSDAVVDGSPGPEIVAGRVAALDFA